MWKVLFLEIICSNILHSNRIVFWKTCPDIGLQSKQIQLIIILYLKLCIYMIKEYLAMVQSCPGGSVWRTAQSNLSQHLVRIHLRFQPLLHMGQLKLTMYPVGSMLLTLIKPVTNYPVWKQDHFIQPGIMILKIQQKMFQWLLKITKKTSPLCIPYWKKDLMQPTPVHLDTYFLEPTILLLY